MTATRRLGHVARHLASAEAVDNIPDPRHDPARMPGEQGRPGNMPRGPDAQGFGIIRHHPPPFDPIAQADEAFAFYEENGYVVVNSLSEQEVTDLNVVSDEFVNTRCVFMLVLSGFYWVLHVFCTCYALVVYCFCE